MIQVKNLNGQTLFTVQNNQLLNNNKQVLARVEDEEVLNSSGQSIMRIRNHEGLSITDGRSIISHNQGNIVGVNGDTLGKLEGNGNNLEKTLGACGFVLFAQ